tara:strand:+ start:123 stop:731 length:609 start_codon:yes stop_codon:yes gene_type:complete
MRAQDITLVGTTFDTDTSDKKWWDYELEQQKFAEEIEKKNADILKPVFKKMVEQDVHMIAVPFSGGGDCGGFDDSIFYYNKDNKEITIDYTRLKPDGWRRHYIPLVHKMPTKTKGKSKVQIFEYQYTDFKDYEITKEWLIQRFYEFGFLNEWGSFAGDYHVSGEVKIYPETGKYTMPYQQSVEEYEDHEPTGRMFNETENDN